MTDAKPAGKPSPYVGPRPFRAGERFYGREDELTGLMDKLLPGGVTLLHSPSGAGKTSLIQASVVPELSKQDFQICSATKPRFSALRVDLPPPKKLRVANRYVFSVVNGLVGHLVDQHVAAEMTIEQALVRFAAEKDPDCRQMIIVDQLEEILRLNPADTEAQKEFFVQLGLCLRRGRRWALLAIREDYLGGLARFRRYFPNELRVTYRLDFLDAEAATAAVQKPAAECGVTFDDDAVRQLVADLGPARGDDGGGGDAGDSAISPPYVESFLLQVVCDSLWRNLSKVPIADFTTINVGDLALVRPYDKTLSEYYRAVVRDAVGENPDAERNLRDWIDEHLISQRTMRRPTLSQPPLKRRKAVMKALTEGYLIRDDPRPGGTWWELSHDMLVQPIVQDNDSWRLSNQAPWQVMFDAWKRTSSREFLLQGDQLSEAQSLTHKQKLSDLENTFFKESSQLAEDKGLQAQLKGQFSRYRTSFYISIALNSLCILLIIFLLLKDK